MTVATTESVASGVVVDQGKVLAYLGLNPTDPKSQAVVAVAQRYDLDPLLKHVIVIPKGGVYITRDGLLHVAHRSGQLDGIVVEQEPTLSDDGKEWVSRVSVWRKDMRHPFTFPGRYPVNGGNRDYAQEMSLKAAEAHSLRRAFDVTGLPTYDEQRPTVAPQRGGLAAVLGDREADPESAAGDGPAEQAPALLDTKSNLAKAMYAAIRDAGVTKDETPGLYLQVTGREIASSKELTEGEARAILAHLDTIGESPVDGEIVEDNTAVRPVCPECGQGKHQNCEGQAWDPEADEPVACTCTDPSHGSAAE